ncbi:MraY family glycosyltransferase [Legionella bononiensis]|uniref:Glycosyltransferase family 4 protein n=1 Tax=Legionella bononiensis TaxID=2793102 RepID=A0ABS1W812_9GAMM|nr:glycosyltransferase family 4 protein [Legionella bononiensis]MBL7480031.1 glycosyltransferase family 4 protein [Legionella bononiensis]MBL7525455.1 glycosyltransferase family 4 protein [Legionella bononiensis]MBL7561638.1 glycosyltransferase family 4 protein [Legionella bononiensis]
MNIILSLILVIASAILTNLFFIFAKNTRLIDKPNERNLHAKPTVRGGGVIFIGLSLITWLLISYNNDTLANEQIIFLSSIFIIATISFFDDLFSLSVKFRFLIQCLIALTISLTIQPEKLDFILFSISSVYIIVPFIFISVIGAINHFNFMDGLDGFCASQAIFLLITYALFFFIQGALLYQEYCTILTLCLLGFLVFNFPPAKIFMGDIGSASLGLITFCLALIAQEQYNIPIIYWFMLNLIFLFDSIITLLRRMIKKEHWIAPHKKHAYQRLKQFGVNSRIILFGQIVINLFFFVLVLLLQNQLLNLIVVLIVQLSSLMFIYYSIENKFPMK